MLQKLNSTTRFLLAALLATAGLGYSALLVTTYLKTTAPSSLSPDLGELHRLIYRAARPISAMQRRLEASDTPLGTGPLITGGTSMASVFTPELSELSKGLTADELAQREGERQALLDWIRTGASRTAYELDDYSLTNQACGNSITQEFLVCETSATSGSAPPRVRIRSLINERCVNCHHEDGDDTARLIPFDSYRAIRLYLRPETHADSSRPWLIAALLGLFPLAALAASATSLTSYPLVARRAILALTAAALIAMAACWFASYLAPLLAAAAVAVISVMVQILGCLQTLLGSGSRLEASIPGSRLTPGELEHST